jgi:hypothetical protein
MRVIISEGFFWQAFMFIEMQLANKFWSSNGMDIYIAKENMSIMRKVFFPFYNPFPRIYLSVVFSPASTMAVFGSYLTSLYSKVLINTTKYLRM